MSGKWFFMETIRPDAKTNLICFPYSGTGASFYASWGMRIPDSFSLLPVCYPMREKRLADPLPSSLQALAADFVQDSIDVLREKPFLLYGHCTGSVIAYEAAKILQETYQLQPLALIAASSPSPFVNQIKPLDESMSLQEFANSMAELGLIRPELAADVSFVSYFMPMMRADYLLHQNYKPEDETVLHCPITAIFGKNDPNITEESVSDWQKLTDHDFRCKAVDEGHFFEKNETFSELFSCFQSFC